MWPEPSELFEWFGETNLSRDERSAVLGVAAEAILDAYTRWHEIHREASQKIAELQEATPDRVDGPLKAKIKRLEKELRAAQNDTNEAAALEDQLAQAQEEAATWKKRCDQFFTMNERNEKILEMYDKVRASGNSGSVTVQSQNLIVQKIKPHEPKRFDGAQDLEVVSQFLEDVEHYVRQGGAVCQAASEDNQKIDTLWRFLTTNVLNWFENSMKKQGVDTIPPKDYNYKVSWDAVKILFKRQYVPKRAISVIRRGWYALKFNRQQVLKFNQRALELVTILGGSLTITRENPLWEEYLIKLPEATQNDISQQARLMDILGGDSQKQMTLSGMMDIVAARTLPFMSMPSGSVTQAQSPAAPPTHGDPMDLSNIENEELNAVVDGKIQCHRCLGFGHIVRQCGTPVVDNRTAQFKSRGGREGGREGLQKRHPPHQPPPTQQSPYRQPSHQPPPTQQPPYRTNQPNWRAPVKRVNNVDDPEARSGAYFDGGWSEEGTLDEIGGVTDLLDLGGSDWDKASKLAQSEGKGAQ